MASPLAALSFALSLFLIPVAPAFDRLPVPGGTSSLRDVMNAPDSVPDDMLLVEAARAWYGARDPIANPAPEVRRLIEHVNTSAEPLAPGPPLPIPIQSWTTVLMLRNPDSLARTLIGSRSAMLMYHGLMGMDDETLHWIKDRRWLLRYIYDDAAARFAFAAPEIRVRNGAVSVPGGEEARAAWESEVGESAANPERFVRALLNRSNGRLAWLYSALSELDPGRLRFALGPRGVELEKLARAARRVSPEWNIDERPFWRPAFDLPLALALVDVDRGGLRGTDAFWREVFRADDLDDFRQRPGEALTAGTLSEILFENLVGARERWDIFSLGQRMRGVEENSAEAGLALRAARQQPALAVLLDRLGVEDLALRRALHRAASSITDRDVTGERGELGMWQSMLAIVERGAITGGLDRAAASRALGELAALPLEDPRTEITGWLLETLLPRLGSRPGAPAGGERLLIETMTGVLTQGGPSRRTPFVWEDLPYVVGARDAIASRMRQVRAAQGTLTLDIAVRAWEFARTGVGDVEAVITALRESPLYRGAEEQASRLEEEQQRRDAGALRREARRAAVLIAGSVLPAFAYAPHLAATETPELGLDLAFRHTFGALEESPATRRMRAWQVARGAVQRGTGWNLQGSLLLLDVALAPWYLRRNTEPPNESPVFDELDVAAFGQIAALTRSAGASRLGLADAASAVEAGRQRARSSNGLAAFDDLLQAAGVGPWRRREIRLSAGTLEEAAAALSYSEAWRIGGGKGLLSPRAPLDGCVCLGETPHAAELLSGRRSAGLVGAGSADVQLRVAAFLRGRGLPDDLFGDVVAGALSEILEHTRALRPDDFRAIGRAAASLTDTRLEEHLLALVADGTLARPNPPDSPEP